MPVKDARQRNDLSQEGVSRDTRALHKIARLPGEFELEAELPMTPSAHRDAEKYYKEAEDCRQLAEKAANPQDKEAWVRLAEDWQKLAQEAERGGRFG